MQGNHVALGEQLRHIHTLDPVFSREPFRPEGVASGDGTPKSLGERNDRAPDVAEPEQPDPASAQLKAALLQKLGTRSRITPAADFPVGPCKAALEAVSYTHLGYECPKVACLAANERVDPHNPATIDAAGLVEACLLYTSRCV